MSVKLAPNDNKTVLKVIKEALPGEILVIDAKATQYNGWRFHDSNGTKNGAWWRCH